MRLSRLMGGVCALALAAFVPTGFVAAEPADASATTTPKPHPAEMMPKASQALMLSLAYSGKHLFAAGDFGEILASNDGREWVQIPTPVRSPLTAIQFVDENNGWAVGYEGVILHSADGGKTWTVQNFAPSLDQPFLDVQFLDKQHGFAIGAYGLFYETHDGGTTWAAGTPAAITSGGFHLYRAIKLGSGDVMVVGEQGLMGLSTDSAQTWTELPKIYEGTFFSAAPIGQTGAIVCGLRGNVFYSANARVGNWKKIETGTTNSMFGCAGIDANHAVLAGVNGILLMATLDSATVQPIPGPQQGVYSAVMPFDGGLIVAGESGVRRVDARLQP
jgi:photosystem II stability/assembly factor-like uncharacterized protein